MTSILGYADLLNSTNLTVDDLQATTIETVSDVSVGGNLSVAGSVDVIANLDIHGTIEFHNNPVLLASTADSLLATDALQAMTSVSIANSNGCATSFTGGVLTASMTQDLGTTSHPKFYDLTLQDNPATLSFQPAGPGGLDFYVQGLPQRAIFHYWDSGQIRFQNNGGIDAMIIDTGANNVTVNDLFDTSLTASLPVHTDASKKLITGLISLGSDVTGILPVWHGGTNTGSLTGNYLISSNAGGTAMNAYTSNTDPIFAGTTTTGDLVINNPISNSVLYLDGSNKAATLTLSAGNLLIGTGPGFRPLVANLTPGASGNLSIVNGSGSITLDVVGSPSFTDIVCASLKDNGLTVSTMISCDASKKLQSTTLANTSANGCTSTLGFSGSTLTLTASNQQDISTSGAPTFANITNSGLTATELVASDASKKLQSVTISNANGTNVSFSGSTLACTMSQNLTTAGNVQFNQILCTQTAKVGYTAGLAFLSLYDFSGTGFAMDLAYAPSVVTSDRRFNIDLLDADRTVTLAGDIKTAGAFTTAGAFAQTLTATAATNVTLPTTGTLATLAGVEIFSNKTFSNSVTLSTAGSRIAMAPVYIGTSSGGTDATTSNVGIGLNAMQNVVNGTVLGENVMIGQNAGKGTALSTYNLCVGIGSAALGSATTCNANVAIGYFALGAATSGNQNVAIGRQCLTALVTGGNNVGVGYTAGLHATGGNNVLIGCNSGNAVSFSGADNTLLGFNTGSTITTGLRNTIVGSGSQVGAAASGRIMIGYNVTNGTDNTAIIGNSTTLTYLACNTDALTNLGDSALRWQNVYVSNSIIMGQALHNAHLFCNVPAGVTQTYTFPDPGSSANVCMDAGNYNVGGQWAFTLTTDSTSSSTGAVSFAGGVGIAKTLFVGTGLSLPTTGGTATTLDYYEEIAASTETYHGIWAADQKVNVSSARVGKLVTITMAAVSATANTAASITSTFATHMPARFRNAVDLIFPISVVNNGTRQTGACTVQHGTSLITVFATPALGNFAGAGTSGFDGFSFSYTTF